MTARFRYPTHTKDFSKNTSIEDDKNSSSYESDNKTDLNSNSLPPSVNEGLSKLVDFIRKHTKQKILENDPEYIKKNKAISAYKKTKSAA